MLCPMTFINTTGLACIGTGCAWWDQLEGRCCILTLAYETANQVGYFRELFQLKDRRENPDEKDKKETPNEYK